MKSVQDFLSEYFRLRTESHKVSCASFVPVIERFFAQGYDPFNPKLSIARSAAEKVLAVSASEGFTEVTTSGFTDGQWRARYRLIASGDTWRISSVEWECGVCHGSGRSKNGSHECKLCKGKGWKLLGNLAV
jgi:hypothetical protein